MARREKREMKMTTASMIGNLTVRSNAKYIVYGSVRGLVSEHRTLAAALKAAGKDRRDCRSCGGGAYSDVRVYESVEGGWEPVGRDEE